MAQVSKTKGEKFMAKYTSTHTGQQIDNAVDAVSNKQDKLVSGTNIKTVNNNSLLGSGNISISGGIIEISTQYVRITDLASGVYKLTYNGTKYIYYYGISSTSKHTVAGDAGAVVLVVSKYSTTYWHWWYINGTTDYATLYYGYTYSLGGGVNSKNINSLYTGTPSNYYPVRSYTSGLQISSYSGSTNCQLYVPYASSSQYGAVKPGTGLTASSGTLNISSLPILTTAPTSANSDGVKIVYLESEPATKYSGYIYLIKSGS